MESVKYFQVLIAVIKTNKVDNSEHRIIRKNENKTVKILAKLKNWNLSKFKFINLSKFKNLVKV